MKYPLHSWELQKTTQSRKTNNTQKEGKYIMIKLFIRKQHEENHKRENAKRVVIVKANPRCAGQQAEDMHMIERLCKDILIAETHDDVLIQTAIAVGYANAMRIHGIIEDTEAVDIVEMLGTMGEDKLHEVEKINANIIMRRLRKKVIQ